MMGECFIRRYWWIYIVSAQMRVTLIPWLVPFWMSSGVQVWGQAVHVMMRCIVCSSPHRHRVSALSSSPRFFRLSVDIDSAYVRDART